MITPIITSLSREVIATVPAIDKEGAYALGATRWEMIRGAVWPHSQGGVVSAILVGLGRAMGETIAAALVIGSSVQVTSHLFVPGHSIPAVIANQFGEASGRVPLGPDRPRPVPVRAHDHRQPDRPRGRGALRPTQQGGLMAAVSDQPTIDLREPGGWRRSKNQIMTVLMYLAFVIILIPLGFVLFEVIAKGAKAISWQFLTNSTIPPNVMPLGQGGMGAAVVGTLEITGFAALMAVPLGILGAVYLNEYGGRSWLAKLVSFMADVMTGVPSIVMGLFIYTIWVIPHGPPGPPASRARSRWPA